MLSSLYTIRQLREWHEILVAIILYLLFQKKNKKKHLIIPGGIVALAHPVLSINVRDIIIIIKFSWFVSFSSAHSFFSLSLSQVILFSCINFFNSLFENENQKTEENLPKKK